MTSSPKTALEWIVTNGQFNEADTEKLTVAMNTISKALSQSEGWKDIESAPINKKVRVKVGDMQFTATLTGGFIDENENDANGWVAEHEGQHPPCWTDGCCWLSNEDMNMSMQPTHWMPLPTPPKGIDKWLIKIKL